MAATGNEFPLLSQLKRLKDWVVSQGYLKSVPIATVGSIGGIKATAFTPTINEYGTYVVNVSGDDGSATVSVPCADTSSAGLMSVADKAKLDALPSEVTVPSVDIVKTTSHSTSYTKDTLEIVCDDSGMVTAMYFVSV